MTRKETLTKVPSDVTLDQLECRTYGHEWERFNPLRQRPRWGWPLSLRCIRCRTERHDAIDINGGLISREYLYPTGYEIAGIVPLDVRRMELRRRLKVSAGRQQPTITQLKKAK